MVRLNFQKKKRPEYCSVVFSWEQLKYSLRSYKYDISEVHFIFFASCVMANWLIRPEWLPIIFPYKYQAAVSKIFLFHHQMI